MAWFGICFAPAVDQVYNTTLYRRVISILQCKGDRKLVGGWLPSIAALFARSRAFCRRQPRFSEHLWLFECSHVSSIIGVHRPQEMIENLGIKWIWRPGMKTTKIPCKQLRTDIKISMPWGHFEENLVCFQSRDWVLWVFIMYKFFFSAWDSSFPLAGARVSDYGPRK